MSIVYSDPAPTSFPQHYDETFELMYPTVENSFTPTWDQSEVILNDPEYGNMSTQYMKRKEYGRDQQSFMTVENQSYPTLMESSVCVPTVQPVQRLNGKQMIKMSEGANKRPAARKRAPKKVKEDVDNLANFRKMERFACIMFCPTCQENSQYNEPQLTFKLCKRCCGRINKFKI